MPLILLALIFLIAPFAAAQEPTETNTVQSQIDATQSQIDDLRRQIELLQKELDVTSQKKQTLQSAVASIDLNIKKLTTQISLTNTQITQKDREIVRLTGSISTTTTTIGSARQQIAETLRNLNERDQEPLAATLLAGASLSAFFDEAVNLGAMRDELQNRIVNLSSLRTTLVSSKSTAEQARTQLASLQSRLAQEKQSLNIARQSQNELLTQTKNQESAYQTLIAAKQAEEDKFEAELIRLAQGLGTADVTTAPDPSRGILRWPIDSVTVTQNFGNTAFAASGAYSGKGHNGIDFRAPIGTPIKASLTGIVEEVNQGAVKNCQYGKWVLIKHGNGLTTLYAHLSAINVSKGQSVATGQVIGYAGDTGYATGPHLHFTVYVSSAVTFKQYTCQSGRTAYIPVAPLNAYLNPLLYLPR